MTDYIPITEAETDPEAPSTSSLWKRWWKNPLAMFEGAAGAPRLQVAALQTGPQMVAFVKSNVEQADMVQFVKSNVERADMTGWLSGQLGNFRAGWIGSYALLGGATLQQFSAGVAYAGSGLVWAGYPNSQNQISQLQAPVVGYGTWVAMGHSVLSAQGALTTGSRFYTLFLRIA